MTTDHAPEQSGAPGELRVLAADAQATRDVGAALAAVVRAGDLLVLSGGLGAGKTTFTQGLGRGLGVRGQIASPTFVIARAHPSLGDGPDLVHVDAYRLTSLEEVDALDLDSTLEESVTVVEWGTGKVEALAPDRLEIDLLRPEGIESGAGAAKPSGGADGPVDLEHLGADAPREIVLRAFGERWDAALPSLARALGVQ